MRKFLFLLLLLIPSLAFAQAKDIRISDSDGDVLNINSDGTIPISGGGGGGGSGTVNSGVNKFYGRYPSTGTTIDDSAVTMDDGTNVGIGVSTPIAKLSVLGTAYVTGNVGIGSTNLDFPLQVTDQSSALNANSGHQSSFFNYAPTGFVDATSSNYGPLTINVGPQSGISASGGNQPNLIDLMIGVDPHSSDTSDVTYMGQMIMLQDTDGSAGKVGTMYNGNWDYSIASLNNFRLATVGAGGPNPVFFMSATDGNIGLGTSTPAAYLSVSPGGTEVLTVGTAGAKLTGLLNVSGMLGLGTTTPTQKLDVRGNVNVAVSAGSPGIILDGGTGSDTDFWIQNVNNNSSGNDDRFQIGTGTVFGTNPKITLLSNSTALGGYVGIGKTTPVNSLNVYGGIDMDTITTPTAPTGVEGSGTGIDGGVYKYKVAYYLRNTNETSEASSASSNITISANKSCDLTIPVSSQPMTGRKIYRTLAGGSTYYFVANVTNNSATTYTDTASDASISANVQAPSVANAGFVLYRNNTAFLKASGDSIYLGVNAGVNIESGTGNTTFGQDAGRYLKQTIKTTAMGYASCRGSTTDQLLSGDYNTCIGYTTGSFLTTGHRNTYLGMGYGSNNTTGAYNIGIGVDGMKDDDGDGNIMMGYHVGFAYTGGGSNNIWIGSGTGAGTVQTVTNSNNVVIIGGDARPANQLTNAGCIGYGCGVANSNQFIIGGSTAQQIGIGTSSVSVNNLVQITGQTSIATSSGNVGVGLTNPSAKLEVSGEAKFSGISSDGSGKVICVNSSGNLGTCSSVVAVDGTCTCN